MMRSTQHSDTTHHRGGFLAPAVMIALLVVMVAVALVLDRLWLDNASVEMNAAVEAAALSAARQLADDDLLRTNADPAKRLQRAREAAKRIAGGNFVAGQPLQLNDVQFVRRLVDPRTGRAQLINTDTNPNSVVVTGRRTRSNGNPVALLFRHLTQQPAGDVSRRVEASLDNHVVGFRPFRDVPVPALPIAILADDSVGGRTDTWNSQIEQQTGADNYSFDRKTGRVTRGADGIPEILLKGMPAGCDPAEANVQLVDLNSDFQPATLVRQIKRGWKRNDLRQWNGELRASALRRGPRTITSFARITDDVPSALVKLIGQCRICLLYRAHSLAGRNGFGSVDCHGFVAGRVMSVRVTADDGCEIVFQPGVLTTRTALLVPSTVPETERARWANRYIYKLQVTH